MFVKNHAGRLFGSYKVPEGSLARIGIGDMLGTNPHLVLRHLSHLKSMGLVVVFIDEVREHDVTATGCRQRADDISTLVPCAEIEFERARRRLVTALITLW